MGVILTRYHFFLGSGDHGIIHNLTSPLPLHVYYHAPHRGSSRDLKISESLPRNLMLLIPVMAVQPCWRTKLGKGAVQNK